jgi:hypothetical protein
MAFEQARGMDIFQSSDKYRHAAKLVVSSQPPGIENILRMANYASYHRPTKWQQQICRCAIGMKDANLTMRLDV